MTLPHRTETPIPERAIKPAGHPVRARELPGDLVRTGEALGCPSSPSTTARRRRRVSAPHIRAPQATVLTERAASAAALTAILPAPAAVKGNVMTDQDLFTTQTTGLAPASPPGVKRLRDGDHLRLAISAVRKRVDGVELRMLAYNGSIPGPTLQVEQGAQVTVDVRNDGDVEATVHWHGLRLENRYDGVPHETQEPCTCRQLHPCRSQARRTSEPDGGRVEGVARIHRYR
jgi:hypothetical protein